MKDSNANFAEMKTEGRNDLIKNEERRLRDGETAEYAFVPLDLPRIEADQKVFESLCNQPVDTYYGRPFKFLRLRDRNNDPEQSALFELQKNPDGWDWNDTAHKYFPELVSWCNEHIPMDNLTFVSLVSSVMHLGPHIDDISINATTNPSEPAHYRALITGATEKTMYSSRQWFSEHISGKEFAAKKFRFMEFPEDSNSFVMNQRDSYHGSRFKGPKLTMYTAGFLNQEKHNALIQRSVKKYPEYVIRVSDLD